MRNQKADVFQACVDFRGHTGEQQHHAGQKYQHRQNRRGQTGRYAQGLTRLKQALTFVDQQEYAGHQQRQHHIDQAIEQQRGSEWRGAECVGEGGQQNRFEHPDPAGNMAEHTGGQGQQVHQQECAKGRCFRQQQIEHGRRGGDVQGSDDQLQERQATARQAQGAASDLDQQVVRVRLLWQATAVDADGQYA